MYAIRSYYARQAKQAGYAQSHHVYHVKAGNWLRVDRGVFRLPGFDDTLESEFIQWSLCVAGKSKRRVIAISHESALYYFGLSPVKPDQVHLSIDDPQLEKQENEGCVFHRCSLSTDMLEQRPGFKITTPKQTLNDMKPDLVLSCRWIDTVAMAAERNLITEQDAPDLLTTSSSCLEWSLVITSYSIHYTKLYDIR